MKRLAIRAVIAAVLIGAGWTAAKAFQAPQADFELAVSSPTGTTTITCVRGCGLQFVRYAPDRSAAQPSFTYTCGGNGGQCGGSVHGWVLRASDLK
jgi:hypothetical protein